MLRGGREHARMFPLCSHEHKPNLPHAVLMLDPLPVGECPALSCLVPASGLDEG